MKICEPGTGIVLMEVKKGGEAIIYEPDIAERCPAGFRDLALYFLKKVEDQKADTIISAKSISPEIYKRVREANEEMSKQIGKLTKENIRLKTINQQLDKEKSQLQVKLMAFDTPF